MDDFRSKEQSLNIYLIINSFESFLEKFGCFFSPLFVCLFVFKSSDYTLWNTFGISTSSFTLPLISHSLMTHNSNCTFSFPHLPKMCGSCYRNTSEFVRSEAGCRMADSLPRTWRKTIRELKVVTWVVGVMTYTAVYASSLTTCDITGNSFLKKFIHLHYLLPS